MSLQNYKVLRVKNLDNQRVQIPSGGSAPKKITKGLEVPYKQFPNN